MPVLNVKELKKRRMEDPNCHRFSTKRLDKHLRLYNNNGIRESKPKEADLNA